jgi:hypothetical protein
MVPTYESGFGLTAPSSPQGDPGLLLCADMGHTAQRFCCS